MCNKLNGIPKIDTGTKFSKKNCAHFCPKSLRYQNFIGTFVILNILLTEMN